MNRGPDPDELEAAALEVADAGQAIRLRAEARAQRTIEDAQAVHEALEILERAAGQVSPRGLLNFAERVGRVYARVVARLGPEERQAARAALRAAKQESLGLAGGRQKAAIRERDEKGRAKWIPPETGVLSRLGLPELVYRSGD